MSFAKTWMQLILRVRYHFRIEIIMVGIIAVFMGITLMSLTDDLGTRLKMSIIVIIGIIIIIIGFKSLAKFKKEYSRRKIWYGDGQDFSPNNNAITKTEIKHRYVEINHGYVSIFFAVFILFLHPITQNEMSGPHINIVLIVYYPLIAAITIHIGLFAVKNRYLLGYTAIISGIISLILYLLFLITL